MMCLPWRGQLTSTKPIRLYPKINFLSFTPRMIDRISEISRFKLLKEEKDDISNIESVGGESPS